MSKSKTGLVEVRILRDCTFGLCGEVAQIPAELVAAAEADGTVDGAASAVAYAKSLAEG